MYLEAALRHDIDCSTASIPTCYLMVLNVCYFQPFAIGITPFNRVVSYNEIIDAITRVLSC